MTALRHRPLARLFALLAVVAITLTGCADDSEWSIAGDRTWAPLPAETPVPPAAPDDPAAYRGVRYRPGGQTPGVRCCEASVAEMPWLRVFTGSATGADRGGAPYFGYEQVGDGRRRMVWFFRLVEPPSLPPAGAGLSSPPPPGEPATAPIPYRESLRAVLDVIALPGAMEDGLGIGCGPDPVFIVRNKGWRLNRTTGRIERIDPDKAECKD